MASRLLRGYVAAAARFVPLAASIAVPVYNYELIMTNREERAEILRAVCVQFVPKRPALRIFGMNPVQCVRPSNTPRNETPAVPPDTTADGAVTADVGGDLTGSLLEGCTPWFFQREIPYPTRPVHNLDTVEGVYNTYLTLLRGTSPKQSV